MEILLIGNGFDLAHKLPTQYKDFLEFCEKARRIYTFSADAKVGAFENKYLKDWEYNQDIKDSLKAAYQSRKNNRVYNEDKVTYNDNFTTDNSVLDEMFSLIKCNAWLKYFLNCPSYVGENWIDFESEISNVIQSLDEARVITNIGGDINTLSDNKQKVLMGMIKQSKGSTSDIFGGVQKIDIFTSKLYLDLKKLIRALELYLTEFVGKIENEIIIPEIENLKIDHVLSFNYTDTYEKIYGAGKGIEYNFIHGEADTSNTINSNNMVLGIDEYLPEERRDKETYFISFKKYYQRILKETGCDYFDWLDTIEEDLEVAYEKSLHFKGSIGMSPRKARPSDFAHNSNLYIFGHSLDITDGDILRSFICNDNINTKIFYYRETEDDKRTLEKLIANLVKVIGQDELIKRTGGSFKTIEFIPQTIEK